MFDKCLPSNKYHADANSVSNAYPMTIARCLSSAWRSKFQSHGLVIFNEGLLLAGKQFNSAEQKHFNLPVPVALPSQPPDSLCVVLLCELLSSSLFMCRPKEVQRGVTRSTMFLISVLVIQLIYALHAEVSGDNLTCTLSDTSGITCVPTCSTPS